LELPANPFLDFQVGMDESRNKLLNSIKNASDISLIIYNGNIENELIVQGTHKLLLMIAAVMLGKKVLYRPNKYHKVRGESPVFPGRLGCD